MPKKAILRSKIRFSKNVPERLLIISGGGKTCLETQRTVSDQFWTTWTHLKHFYEKTFFTFFQIFSSVFMPKNECFHRELSLRDLKKSIFQKVDLILKIHPVRLRIWSLSLPPQIFLAQYMVLEVEYGEARRSKSRFFMVFTNSTKKAILRSKIRFFKNVPGRLLMVSGWENMFGDPENTSRPISGHMDTSRTFWKRFEKKS